MMGSFHEEKTVEDFIRQQTEYGIKDKQYRDYLLGQLTVRQRVSC